MLTPRHFDRVQTDLQVTVQRLNESDDAQVRLALLRKMRELLEEADRIAEANLGPEHS